MLLFTSLLLATGCSDFFEEKVDEPVAILSDDEDCFSIIIDEQVAYFRNQISLAHAHASVDCAIENLQAIEKVFQGSAQANGFTAEEFNQLLTAVFFRSSPLPQNLINEAMVLKSWFIGGARDYFSAAEIAKIITLLEKWKVFLTNIDPIRADLNLVKGHGSEEQLRQAQNKLLEELTLFIANLEKVIDPFEIEVLERFFAELRNLTQGEDYSTYIKLFHGITWLINNDPNKLDLPKTTRAYLIFYNEYLVLNYKFDLTAEDFQNNTEAYLKWLPQAVAAINQALGENYVIPYEALLLISEFIYEQF